VFGSAGARERGGRKEEGAKGESGVEKEGGKERETARTGSGGVWREKMDEGSESLRRRRIVKTNEEMIKHFGVGWQ